MNIKQAQHLATLLANTSDTPTLDTDILLTCVLHQPRAYLYANPDSVLTNEQQVQFKLFLQRRCKQEPIAYIIGHKEFWSLELNVNQNVLIPRPETELLVETVLAQVTAERAQIADLGTGSGAIALALAYEKPQWQLYATDVSENALRVASDNAQHLALSNISFLCGHWCDVLPCKMDAIVSNPPYLTTVEWPTYEAGLRYEPKEALVAGEDGLTAIREICATAGAYLKSQGYLLVEHGFEQGAAVRAIFAENGYKDIVSVRDLAGLERVTYGRFS